MTPILPELKVDGALIASAAGFLVALVLAYVPKVNVWFNDKTENNKNLLMLIMVLVVGLLIAVFSFTGIWVLIPANPQGIILLVIYMVIALLNNKVTGNILPDTSLVAEAKERQELRRLVKLSAKIAEKG